MGLIEFAHGPLFGWLHRTLAKGFLSNMDYVIVQSSHEEKIVRKVLPHTKVSFVRGPYFTWPIVPNPVSREKAREKLGVSGNVILFFGFVRPYKGLEFLIESLPSVLKVHPDTTLIIAGEFWSGKEKLFARIAELGLQNRIKIIDQFIPTSETSLYFCAADVCVIPYLAISQSAIIPTSFAYGLPVIATRVGGNGDWVEHEKNGLLIPPADSDALGRALIVYFSEKKSIPMRKYLAAEKKKDLWTPAHEKKIINPFGKGE